MMQKRRVLVTGASGGIGAAVVKKLLNNGHLVAAADTELHDAHQEHPSLLKLELDLCDDQSCKAAVKKAVKQFGNIDTLINAAGICYGGDPSTANIDEWTETFNVNVRGMFRITQLVIPSMQQSVRADIVNISSIWGTDYNPNLLSYSASKFAVEGFTGGLRTWAFPQNIRVTALQVDKVDTGFRRNLGSKGNFPVEQLKKMLTPDDVSNAVCFVLDMPSTGCVSSMRLDAPLWYQNNEVQN
ncbi:SDR family oxidoreductase [Atlantibacter subterranea]|uniref:SDR family oxidoreductase n=1 Tax=Atlantibacter subterraneus TaxID=255519 RepID=UPI0020C3A364|nr:SDR family oxidoreductase [Atlantibacter subterranea]UTJ46775.1 SDR family oxidoreductase [Atlantibacter subterranea]